MEKFNDDQPLFTFAPTKGQLKKLVKTTLVVTGVTALVAGATVVYAKRNPEVLESIPDSIHVETNAN